MAEYAITCNDLSGCKDKVGTERLNDRCRKDLRPVCLLFRHRSYQALRDQDGQAPQGQDPLSGDSWDQPCGKNGSSRGTYGQWRETNGEGEG